MVFMVERRTTKFLPTKHYRIVLGCGLVYCDHENIATNWPKIHCSRKFYPLKNTHYTVCMIDLTRMAVLKSKLYIEHGVGEIIMSIHTPCFFVHMLTIAVYRVQMKSTPELVYCMSWHLKKLLSTKKYTPHVAVLYILTS